VSWFGGVFANSSMPKLVQHDNPMSAYTATIRWSRDGADGFTKGQYSRAHEWAFDGGAVVPASASPHVVPAPWSDSGGVDPEEAFVASLASCHMLFFIDFARRAGFVIDHYVDEAEGVLEKRADGKMAMTRVTLWPHVSWAGDPPDKAVLADLNHRAHESCFIANSVTTEVKVEY
jgi:organic hydroperoxide reductase OsmC/OhrA